MHWLLLLCVWWSPHAHTWVVLAKGWQEAHSKNLQALLQSNVNWKVPTTSSRKNTNYRFVQGDATEILTPTSARKIPRTIFMFIAEYREYQLVEMITFIWAFILCTRLSNVQKEYSYFMLSYLMGKRFSQRHSHRSAISAFILSTMNFLVLRTYFLLYGSFFACKAMLIRF